MSEIETRKYTRETRAWLNKRFDLFDQKGVYIPNQPAYGFNATAFRLEEYARMFAVLKTLNRLSFKSLLDVGSADGYGPALIHNLFGADLFGTDLSDRALVRSYEIFNGVGVASDAHQLPFRDKSMDVCLCSEVLEHVVDPAAVIRELVRVARKYVVLSTPRAGDEAAKERHFKMLDPNEPHAHIHFFTDKDIQILCGSHCIYRGARTRLVNSVLNRLAWADDSSLIQRQSYYEFTVETTELGHVSREAIHHMLLGKYDHQAAWKKRLLRPITVAGLLWLDTELAEKFPRAALDHLVIIPVDTTRFQQRKQLSERSILRALLGEFRVEPFRRRN